MLINAYKNEVTKEVENNINTMMREVRDTSKWLTRSKGGPPSLLKQNLRTTFFASAQVLDLAIL